MLMIADTLNSKCVVNSKDGEEQCVVNSKDSSDVGIRIQFERGKKVKTKIFIFTIYHHSHVEFRYRLYLSLILNVGEYIVYNIGISVLERVYRKGKDVLSRG